MLLQCCMANQKLKNLKIQQKKTFEGNLSGEGLPSINIKENISIIDAIIISKLVTSKSEIRRLNKSKGVKINNKVVDEEKLIIKRKLLTELGFLKLSIGKKKHIKLIIDQFFLFFQAFQL